MAENTGDFLLDAVNKAMAASDEALMWQKAQIGISWILRKSKLLGNTIPPVYVANEDIIAEVKYDWELSRDTGDNTFSYFVFNGPDGVVEGYERTATAAMLQAMLRAKLLKEVK